MASTSLQCLSSCSLPKGINFCLRPLHKGRIEQIVVNNNSIENYGCHANSISTEHDMRKKKPQKPSIVFLPDTLSNPTKPKIFNSNANTSERTKGSDNCIGKIPWAVMVEFHDANPAN